MNAEEWDSATDPQAMLAALRAGAEGLGLKGNVIDRKCRLFALARLGLLRDSPDMKAYRPIVRKLVRLAERRAAGKVSDDKLDEVNDDAAGEMDIAWSGFIEGDTPTDTWVNHTDQQLEGWA